METLQVSGAEKIARLVFELPMRDGNALQPKALRQGISVFELPMRDGNLNH